MRSYLNYIGGIVVLVGIYFIFHRFIGYFHEIKAKELISWSLLALLSELAVLYAVVNIFLVMAWKNILKIYSVDVSLAQAFKIYSSSQLAKYVPGNVFHLAGRQVIAMQHGLPLKPVMKSIVAELICLAMTGALFSLWYLPHIIPAISIQYILMALIVVVSVAVYFVLKFHYQRWLWVLFQQSIFLVSSGLLFYVIIAWLEGGTPELNTMLIVTSSYIAAWLIGMVTPGAPAGVGVREAILIFLLAMFSPSNVLIAVLFGRIVTVVGDFIFYLSSLSIRYASNEK
jgi:hypothetical protein